MLWFISKHMPRAANDPHGSEEKENIEFVEVLYKDWMYVFVFTLR